MVRRRVTGRPMALILLYNALLVCWLLLKPGSHALFAGVDNVGQFLGPLVAVLCCVGCPLGSGREAHSARHSSPARRWAPTFLGVGLFSYAIGQIIWSVYELLLRQPAPFPSWADAAFLLVYPFLLLGILLLPARPLPMAARIRILVDGLMIMAGVATLSWYFVLGPTLLQSSPSPVVAIVGAAYPLGDLMLICCLLFLAIRAEEAHLQRVVRILTLALGIIVVTDTMYLCQQVHGIYRTGDLIDAGWPLGFMLVGLAGRYLRRDPVGQAADDSHSRRVPLALPPLWRSLLPYAAIPAVTALVGYTWIDHSAPDDMFESGVYAGAAILVALLLVRQVLALLENRRLYRETAAYAHSVADLNDDLRATQQQLHTVYRTMACGVTVLDARGAVIDANDAAQQILGHNLTQMRGRTLPDLVGETIRFDNTAFPATERPAMTALRTGLPQHGTVLNVTRFDGQNRWLQVDAVPIQGPDGTAIQAVCSFIDITERKRAEATLAHQASHDALTDLPNRALLRERLARTLDAMRHDGGSLALLLLDLDRFKEINDTLGHHYGDLLLQQVGARMRDVLRSTDTVARLGGDEFAILLPTTGADGARAAAQAILDALTTPCMVDGQPLDVGASIGIALYPDHGDDAETLLQHADVAMYAAKRDQSSYALYDAAHNPHCPRRLAMVGDLRRAIAEDGLQLYYQPKIDVASEEIGGVEALLRWPHPDHGFVLPDQFIPLAEQTGVIVPLTAWVLETALRQCRDWQRAGRHLPVAVNLSTRTLQDQALPDTVALLLRRYEIAPPNLTLEITESSLMADPVRALEVLRRLDALGVRLAIDDFGTGYSSLGYLKGLPVDEVKIDKSFMLGMGATDSKDAAIVCSVIGLAHGLGLDVVAEGIETAAAWETLAALQCDIIQGYYISRPLPTAELERWLDTAPRGHADRASA